MSNVQSHLRALRGAGYRDLDPEITLGANGARFRLPRPRLLADLADRCTVTAE